VPDEVVAALCAHDLTLELEVQDDEGGESRV
jgi:hypothetical protein